MRAFWGLEVPKGPQGITFQVQGCDRLNVSNVALGAEARSAPRCWLFAVICTACLPVLAAPPASPVSQFSLTQYLTGQGQRARDVLR